MSEPMPGFLPISLPYYLSLLDRTTRQLHGTKRGRASMAVKPIWERPNIEASAWSKLVGQFGRLFINVAGKPQTISATRSRIGQQQGHMRKEALELLTAKQIGATRRPYPHGGMVTRLRVKVMQAASTLTRRHCGRKNKKGRQIRRPDENPNA